MKNLFFVYFMSFLWCQSTDFIPYDWGGQFGHVNRNGGLFWNEDWRAGRLFFDGTWTIYPRLFGPEIEKKFINSNQDEPQFDTTAVTSYFIYDQGDYLLDRLSVGANYAGNGRNLHIHGFKRSYSGRYNQYDSGSSQPLQQTYTVSYESKKDLNHAGVSVGYFNTYSGLENTLTQGIIDNRMTTANSFWDRSFGNLNSKVCVDQFLQRYKANHSLSKYSGVRYLTRSKYSGEIVWNKSEHFSLFSKLEMNSRSIKSDSINVVEWNEIIVGSKLKEFNIQTGILHNNNNIENEFNVEYEKRINSINGKIDYERNVLPVHYYARVFDTTNLSNLGRRDVFTGKINWTGKKNDILIFFSNRKYNTISNSAQTNTSNIPSVETNFSYGIQYQTTFIPFIKLETKYSRQDGTSLISDGIKDKIKLETETQLKLFDGFMDLNASVSFNGWMNRQSVGHMHPIEMIPIRNSNSADLDDVWFINGSVTAYVSTFTIKYEWYNIAAMILASSETDQDNYIQVHPEMPLLGRQVNLSLEWHFLD